MRVQRRKLSLLFLPSDLAFFVINQGVHHEGMDISTQSTHWEREESENEVNAVHRYGCACEEIERHAACKNKPYKSIHANVMSECVCVCRCVGGEYSKTFLEETEMRNLGEKKESHKTRDICLWVVTYGRVQRREREAQQHTSTHSFKAKRNLLSCSNDRMKRVIILLHTYAQISVAEVYTFRRPESYS